MTEKPIEAVLVADSDVTDDISTYDFGSGAAPAIFTGRQIPEDATNIAILIEQIGTSLHGTRGQRGSEAFTDVTIRYDKKQSAKAARAVAIAVWNALDRQPLPFAADGYEQTLCLADNPIRIEDPEGFPGYVVRVRVKFLVAV